MSERALKGNAGMACCDGAPQDAETTTAFGAEEGMDCTYARKLQLEGFQRPELAT